MADTILIIEDEVPMQSRLCRILGGLGYAQESVCVASDIKQGQTIVNREGDGIAPLLMALVDLGLPDGNGSEMIAWLRERYDSMPVLVISAWSTEEMILGALRAGASGYLLKERDDLEIAASLKNVLRGGAPIDPFIARRILDLIGKPLQPHAVANSALRDALSERELAILNYVAAGMSNREIAETVNLSRWTVDTHVQHIYRKLAVNSRTQALRAARTHGLLR